MEDLCSDALDLPRPRKARRVDLLRKQGVFGAHITHRDGVKRTCRTCGRNDAASILLIDGEEQVSLLIQFGIGLRRCILEVLTLDPGAFADRGREV